MHVYHMEPGAKSPDGRNRLSIELTGSGKWTVDGSIAPSGKIAIFFTPAPFDTKEAAKDAALAFAARHDAEEVYLEYPHA